MKGVSSAAGPIVNAWLPNVVGNLTATGTNQAGAFAIPFGQDFSVFGTVAAGTGAILPGVNIGLGESYEVANHGVNALLVYPALGGKIGASAVNASYSIAVGKYAIFKCVGPGAWASCP